MTPSEAGRPQTIQDLVGVNHGAALVFPDGPPQSVAAPGWSMDGTTEMDKCQRDFFSKHCHDVPRIPLADIVYFSDCINFMSAEVAAPWLPIWMCGAFYAVDVLNDPTENVTSWAQYALERCLESDRVGLSFEAIKYFAEHVCDPPELEPDLYRKIDAYRASLRAL